tara:strand:- start:16310 stop:17221 length:912 start_codon:yes stop_codon:yes gene_type:complete
MFNDNFLTFNRNDNIAVQSGEKMILLKKKSFEYKNINISSTKTLMGILNIIYTITYLWSEVLQSSPLISQGDHYKNTVISTVYDLLFINILSFALIKYSNLNLREDLIRFRIFGVYMVSCILGAIIFGLMGEIPWLSHLEFIPGFWNELDTKAKLTIIFLGLTTTILIMNEIMESIKIRKCRRIIGLLLGYVFIYSLVYLLLSSYNAKSINIHVHHAIFSSILTLCFVNWENTIELIMHGVLMGIMIEGINFYGIGELSLFLTNNTGDIDFKNSVVVAGFASFIGILFISILDLIYTYFEKIY